MLSNLASLQRIVGFAGEFQTGFKNSELLGTYEVLRAGISFQAAGGLL